MAPKEHLSFGYFSRSALPLLPPERQSCQLQPPAGARPCSHAESEAHCRSAITCPVVSTSPAVKRALKDTTTAARHSRPGPGDTRPGYVSADWSPTPRHGLRILPPCSRFAPGARHRRSGHEPHGAARWAPPATRPGPRQAETGPAAALSYLPPPHRAGRSP